MGKQSPGMKQADFSYQTLVGNFEVDPKDTVYGNEELGLIRESMFLYGIFRDEDGRSYGLIRAVNLKETGKTADTEIPGTERLFLMSRSGSECYRLEESSRKLAQGSSCVVKFSMAEDAVIEILSESGEQATSVRQSSDRIVWDEKDRFSLRGEMIGPAHQWYTPWRDGGWYYPSYLYLAEGVVQGIRVRGFLGFDTNYLVRGSGGWHETPIIKDVELAWFVFGNLYEDGEVEAGHIACGHGEWGISTINRRDGNLISTNDVDCRIERRDQNWADRVHFIVAGQDWKCILGEEGRMPDFGKIVNPQQEGRMRKVGDDRIPIDGFAWGETMPSHGSRRR